MELNKIEKLENEISKKSFQKANKSKNGNWYWTSIIFQGLNIIICFFGLYLFLTNVIEDFPLKEYIIGIISILILFFWERLKREQIRTSTISFLREKKTLNNKNIPNTLLTLFLITCSSLIAIQGGKELSNKEDKIETIYESKYNTKIDSINNYYDKKISSLEKRIEFIYQNAKNYKGEQRSLKQSEYDEIKETDTKISQLKLERDENIKKTENKIESKQTKESEKNENIVLIFIISSIIFEFFIIFGVSYCGVYDFTSYHEITQSDSYKKLLLYSDYLNILFENGKLNKDDKCPSENKITDVIRLKYRNTLNIKEFLTIISYLNIIETRKDRRKYFLKNYDESVSLLKSYFQL